MEEKRRESQGNLSFLPKGSRTILSESENDAPMSKEDKGLLRDPETVTYFRTF